MACSSNSPAVQFGDSGAAPNVVGGFASGEMRLQRRVAQPTPRGRSRRRHARAHLRQHQEPQHLPWDSHGNQRHVAAQRDHFLRGHHHRRLEQFRSGREGSRWDRDAEPSPRLRVLRGTRSWPPSTRTGPSPLPPTTPATHAASTVRTAPFPYRAFGTTSRNRFSTGTFLITSGGPFVSGPAGPGPSTGGLATLAGYGSFSVRARR